MSKNKNGGKNINKKNKPKTIIDLIDLHVSQAREKILSILIKDYAFDKKKAEKAEEAIFLSTSSKMREIYTYDEPFFCLPVDDSGRRRTDISNSKYPADFDNWTITALTIPFYQSLGDTIGYKNSDWEFNYGDIKAGPGFVNTLLYEFISLGGINDLSITNWKASDDTILYMATMKVLSEPFKDINDFGQKIRMAYLETLPLIQNRHPGAATINALEIQKNIEWNKLHYNNQTNGNGSTMRSGCIGIFYPGKHNRKMLIALAVESSRITHNSATAILGSVTAALFTAYALEKVAINLWPHKLLKLLKSGVIDQYIQQSRSNEYPLFAKDKIIFISQWDKYVDLLFSGINPKSNMTMMNDPVQRYIYLSDNFSKGCDTPGACADDVLIMAYHALLQSGGIFEKLVVYSILHPGDSDTVGSIALSWFGALYHSCRNSRLIGHRFEELEFYTQLYDLFKFCIPEMPKIYYYDIYLNIAVKYLRQIVGRR